MSWFIEHLHRDGSVLERIALSPPHPAVDADAANADSVQVVRVGRALDNDLVLDDVYCAAHHARLEISADGLARLVDAGSANGIVNARNKRAPMHLVSSDEIFRLGHSQIRVRSSDWPLTPERVMSRVAAWPLALLLLALVLMHGGWEMWLKDVQEKSPAYLYALSALTAGLCFWSAIYAVFGRLITGVDRFFSHLAIACTGYLAATLILTLLETLAFSMSWLWPIRITQPVVVIVAAMTVRFHLRLADPRHWRTVRVAIVMVATFAIVIPLAQQWVSNKRLTDVQTINAIEHPALRLAKPVSLQAFNASAVELKTRVDKARNNDTDVTESLIGDDD